MDIETKSAFLLMLQAQSVALSALSDVLQLLTEGSSSEERRKRHEAYREIVEIINKTVEDAKEPIDAR